MTNRRTIDGYDVEVSDGDKLVKDPVVSVLTMTHQHVKYIAQALDSILRQRVDFPYEICLGEDGSTDGTREICLAYQERHPDKIRVFLRDRSNPARAKYKMVWGHNGLETERACRGQYVATLEGDDYWVTADKLQKQVQLFRLHPEAVLCGGRCQFWHEGYPSPYKIYPSQSPEETEALGPRDMLRATWFFHPSTRMVPKWICEDFDKTLGNDGCYFDWLGALFVLARSRMRAGSLLFVDEVLSTYRIHAGGLWSGAQEQGRQKQDVLALQETLPLFSGEDAAYLRRELVNKCSYLATYGASIDERLAYARTGLKVNPWNRILWKMLLQCTVKKWLIPFRHDRSSVSAQS